jgi:hypothetical protein
MVLALLRGGLETIGLAQTRPARGRIGPNAIHSSHVISLLDIAKVQHPLGVPQNRRSTGYRQKCQYYYPARDSAKPRRLPTSHF